MHVKKERRRKDFAKLRKTLYRLLNHSSIIIKIIIIGNPPCYLFTPISQPIIIYLPLGISVANVKFTHIFHSCSTYIYIEQRNRCIFKKEENLLFTKEGPFSMFASALLISKKVFIRRHKLISAQVIGEVS